ncbi:hypothetical protein KIN20_017723 [Parelaphostrongylus tenuis]|uniref:Uncharacterized protein n=1 Tax=Parelaphostrongylus tenuis TaxID=148309 RepID=A0AAD5QRM7_PARTN|nr:hypothetical protein KIN20_017723 [Parelaphostrongylus tenuis]
MSPNIEDLLGSSFGKKTEELEAAVNEKDVLAQLATEFKKLDQNVKKKPLLYYVVMLTTNMRMKMVMQSRQSYTVSRGGHAD